MGSRDRSRRDVLRFGAGLASVGAVGSLGGCFGLFGDDKSEIDENSRAKELPSRTGALLSIDFQRIREDDGLVNATDETLAERRDTDPTVPESLDGALNTLEERYGLDPSGMNRAIGFVGKDIHKVLDGSGDTAPFWGVLGYTDWDEDAMVESFTSVSNGPTREATYKEKTIHDNGRVAMAPLGEGNVVYGSRAAVEATIDVAAGDGKGVSGELRKAFDATSGEFARFAGTLDARALAAATVGTDVADALPLSSIQHVSGAVFTDGDQRGGRVTAKLSSATDAEQLLATVDTFVALTQEQGVKFESLKSYETAIGSLATSSNGKTMSARYRDSKEAFNEQAGDALASLLVGLVDQS